MLEQLYDLGQVQEKFHFLLCKMRKLNFLMTAKVYEQFFPNSIFLLSHDAPSTSITLSLPENPPACPKNSVLGLFWKAKSICLVNHGPGGKSDNKKRPYCLWLKQQLLEEG